MMPTTALVRLPRQRFLSSKRTVLCVRRAAESAWGPPAVLGLPAPPQWHD